MSLPEHDMKYVLDGKTYIADVKTWRAPASFWVKEVRGDTIFPFQPVSDRSTDRAIIVYLESGGRGCYDRIDAVTRKAC